MTSPESAAREGSLLASVKEAQARYAKELTFLGVLFALTITFTNFVFHFFHLHLVPFAAASFDAFHTWCQMAIRLFIFSWLAPILDWAWYGLEWLASFFAPVTLRLPHIQVPPTLVDVSLISLALTRVFGGADLFVPRSEREQAERDTSTEQFTEMQALEGWFWGPLHRLCETVNSWIWRLVGTITGFFDSAPRIQPWVKRIAGGLAAVIFQWGFIRLAGYVINALAARKSSAPIMAIRRRFLKMFVVSLIAALAATAGFFVVNAWLADVWAH
jgi:hypothetical protein